MKNFALIGAAGYIAPRHLAAVRDTGNRLVAALDKSDSVGILDQFFPEADFFTEFERFDRHLEKLRRQKDERAVDFVSIASPNYLHDAHIRFALRVGADAVCEKPLVLNPWNLDALAEVEKDFGGRVYSVLQLRLHPAVAALREKISVENRPEKHEIDLTYITGRGRWYAFSWKGDQAKSGGIATNIGIHFFDMLTWVFGRVQEVIVQEKSAGRVAGFLELEKARVRWLLSLDVADLPPGQRERGERVFRCLNIDGRNFDFSSGFTDLHTQVYREILAGRGFGLEENRAALDLVFRIRNAAAQPGRGPEILNPDMGEND